MGFEQTVIKGDWVHKLNSMISVTPSVSCKLKNPIVYFLGFKLLLTLLHHRSFPVRTSAGCLATYIRGTGPGSDDIERSRVQLCVVDFVVLLTSHLPSRAPSSGCPSRSRAPPIGFQCCSAMIHAWLVDFNVIFWPIHSRTGELRPVTITDAATVRQDPVLVEAFSAVVP